MMKNLISILSILIVALFAIIIELITRGKVAPFSLSGNVVNGILTYNGKTFLTSGYNTPVKQKNKIVSLPFALRFLVLCFFASPVVVYVMAFSVQINTWLYNHITFHIEKTLYYINENFVWRTSPHGKNILLVSIIFFAVLFIITFLIEKLFYSKK